LDLGICEHMEAGGGYAPGGEGIAPGGIGMPVLALLAEVERADADKTLAGVFVNRFGWERVCARGGKLEGTMLRRVFWVEAVTGVKFPCILEGFRGTENALLIHVVFVNHNTRGLGEQVWDRKGEKECEELYDPARAGGEIQVGHGG